MKTEEVSAAELPGSKRAQKKAEKQRKKGASPAKPKASKKLWISRAIALGIIVAVAAGVFWFFSSDASEPLKQAAAPVWDPMVGIINDPLGVDWGGYLYGAALFAISYIGIITFMLDER